MERSLLRVCGLLWMTLTVLLIKADKHDSSLDDWLRAEYQSYLAKRTAPVDVQAKPIIIASSKDATVTDNTRPSHATSKVTALPPVTDKIEKERSDERTDTTEQARSLDSDDKSLSELGHLVDKIIVKFSKEKRGSPTLKKDIENLRKIADRMGIRETTNDDDHTSLSSTNADKTKKDVKSSTSVVSDAATDDKSSPKVVVVSDDGRTIDAATSTKYNPSRDSQPVEREESEITSAANRKQQPVVDAALSFEDFKRAFTKIAPSGAKKDDVSAASDMSTVRSLPIDELYDVLKRETQALKNNLARREQNTDVAADESTMHGNGATRKDSVAGSSDIDADLATLMAQRNAAGSSHVGSDTLVDAAPATRTELTRITAEMRQTKREMTDMLSSMKSMHDAQQSRDNERSRDAQFSGGTGYAKMTNFGDSHVTAKKGKASRDGPATSRLVDSFIDDFTRALHATPDDKQDDASRKRKRELVVKFFSDFAAADHVTAGVSRGQISTLMRGDDGVRTAKGVVSRRDKELAKRVINGLLEARDETETRTKRNAKRIDRP